MAGRNSALGRNGTGAHFRRVTNRTITAEFRVVGLTRRTVNSLDVVRRRISIEGQAWLLAWVAREIFVSSPGRCV